jgi:hypothetical protein
MRQARVHAPRVFPLPRIPFALAVALALTTGLSQASIQQTQTVDERIRGAERVVVATVRNVAPAWRENQFGDRLIVSRLELSVSETLKGTNETTAWMDMEGGTLDGLTLRVTDLPTLEPGERAVFFLEPDSRGVFTPHLRGEGILTLDDRDVVRGTSTTLSDIRGRARSLAQ